MIGSLFFCDKPILKLLSTNCYTLSMIRKKIAVLRGGPSYEYPFSLKTGSHVLRSFPEHYEPVDILIDRGGQWHRQGWPIRPEQAFEGTDATFNALHGAYGEDGILQQEFSRYGVLHTGPSAFGSVLAMNKLRAKKAFERSGIKTPQFLVFSRDEENRDERAFNTFRSFPFPAVVKPVSGGGSIGVSVARSYDEFLEALESALQFHPEALVEEYISGKEVSCATVEHFRGQKEYSLLPVQIQQEGGICSALLREKGECVGACPAPLTHEEKREVERLTGLAHTILHLRHYSQSEFIVSPRRGIYILETDALPHLHEESPLPHSLQGVGSNFPEFLDHVLRLAMDPKHFAYHT